jgi:hypothetical protein
VENHSRAYCAVIHATTQTARLALLKARLVHELMQGAAVRGAGGQLLAVFQDDHVFAVKTTRASV